MPILRCFALAAAALGLPLTALAQPSPGASDTGAARSFAAVRLASGEAHPTVDGRVEEPVWERAPVLTDFVQREPAYGEAAGHRTVSRMLLAHDALYVAVEAFDPEPDRIVGRMTRRDDMSSSDWILLLLDADHDRRTAYEFFVNPAGVKVDGIAANGQNDDFRWDAVWDVAAERTASGWSAEFRIPLSQIQFPGGVETWGVQVGRLVQRTGEMSFWAATPPSDPNFVTYMGEMTGLGGLEVPRRLEVLPYTLARLTRVPGDEENPFYDDNDWKLSGGVDVKYGLTSNITLDATLNPDFGQVEADPSEVNLTAFESFFTERRPFFIEGADIYRYGLGVGEGDSETLFYSRRIGRTPQAGADDRGGYVEAPEQTSILGAAKISGRTAGGWSVGLLEAVTEEEEAEVFSGTGETFRDVVEPLSHYTVARARRDFRGGATQVGGIATGVQRRLDATGLEDRLRSQAYTGGVDVYHRFADDRFRVSGKVLGTWVEGSEEAILATQLSSARYFQRTDADHVEVDSTATSLAGWSSVAEIAKESGGPFRFAAFLQARSPGFEPNDVGFMRETDMVGYGAYAGYRILRPTGPFRRGGLNFNYHTFDDFGGRLVAHGGNVNANAQLVNFWFVYGGLRRNFDNWRTDATRGGPSLFEPGGTGGWVGVDSDDRKRVQGGAFGEWWSEDDTGGGTDYYEVWVEWQASERTSIRLSPWYQDRFDRWQYVATPEDGSGQAHYVFADIDQRTFGMTIRASHNFTPDFSLQVYGQPFVSAGDYGPFREVANPAAERFEERFAEFPAGAISLSEGSYAVDADGDGAADFEFGDRDFNFREFRSNVVARWEYRPGSAAFFVWSQSRDSFVPDPSFRPRDDLDALFGAPARNVFLVKVNGWLNL